MSNKKTPPLNSQAPPPNFELTDKYLAESYAEIMFHARNGSHQGYLYFANFVATVVNVQGAMLSKGVLEDFEGANHTVLRKYQTMQYNCENNIKALTNKIPPDDV